MLALLKQAWPVRLVAILTVSYSVSITVAPKLLAKPCGIAESDGSVSDAVAGLTRSIGTRDAALAAALAVSPVGYPMLLLTGARVLSDGADAFWFAQFAPRSQWTKVLGVAAAWAALEGTVGAVYGRRSRSSLRTRVGHVLG